jgi:hypothetical protein
MTRPPPKSRRRVKMSGMAAGAPAFAFERAIKLSLEGRKT